MTLEQQLADAIAAQNALTQVVAGKQAQIDGATGAQQAAFAAWMDNAKHQFASNNFRALFVGGSESKWYPVVFSLPARVLGRVNIGRGVHNDADKYGKFNGSMNFSLDVVSGEWGGAPGRVIPISYQYSLGTNAVNPYVADFAADVYGMALVVYLLGQRTYDISTSWQGDVTAYTADKNNLIFSAEGDEYAIFRDARTEVAASMLPNNYLRGG